MKPLLALCGLLAVAATSSMSDDGYPPDRFRGDNSAQVFFQTDIHPRCGKDPPIGVLEACQSDTTITLPNPCGAEWKGEDFARLACHELGHRNGWPGNHPRP